MISNHLYSLTSEEIKKHNDKFLKEILSRGTTADEIMERLVDKKQRK